MTLHEAQELREERGEVFQDADVQFTVIIGPAHPEDRTAFFTAYRSNRNAPPISRNNDFEVYGVNTDGVDVFWLQLS